MMRYFGSRLVLDYLFVELPHRYDRQKAGGNKLSGFFFLRTSMELNGCGQGFGILYTGQAEAAQVATAARAQALRPYDAAPDLIAE